MKSIGCFLFLLLFGGMLMGQTATVEPKLLGKCQRNELEVAPYQEWYHSFYNGYEPSQEVMDKLRRSSIADYRIQIFFGSWCGDSKREMPRFLKILDQLNFPKEKVELIAVDKGEQYKQSPDGEEKGKSIYRVPVFILLKGEKEIGRIVEYPVSSLERDLLVIVQQQPYMPNYYSYPLLSQWHMEGVLADKNIDTRGLVNQIRGKVHSTGELNAAGYVFLKSQQVKEAIQVFLFNVYLFPEEANSYDSLAEAFTADGNKEGALWAYEKILKLDPDNERAKQAVEELKALTEAGKAGK